MTKKSKIKTKKIIKIVIIVLITIPIVILLTILGNMIFWSLAMGKAEEIINPNELAPSPKEEEFIQSFWNNKRLNISYPTYDSIKDGKKHIIYLTEIDTTFSGSKEKLNRKKQNLKKTSDSVFAELMKVYSLKPYVDSLEINIYYNGTPYKVDTSFIYLIK